MWISHPVCVDKNPAYCSWICFTVYSVTVFQYFVANGKEVLVLYQRGVIEVWVSIFLVIELYELTIYLLMVGSIIR